MIEVLSWERLLRTARRGDHVVQLSHDERFLARTVVHFLGSGLVEGDAAVVLATAAHAEGVTARLAAAGFDIAGALDRRQLVLLEARHCVGQIMAGGAPDRALFLTLVGAALERTRAAGFSRVRLFGELVDLIRDRDFAATMRLEALWGTIVAEQNVSLLCAYGLDSFDREAHRGILHEIAAHHSHVIPAEDYDRLDRAVDQAYADVFGTHGDARALRALLASRCDVPAEMPAAARALLGLRELPARVADLVLERARHHYGVGGDGG